MKRSFFRGIAFFPLLAATLAFAQERPFGFGVILGEPTGLSAKLWTSPTTAYDFGFGWAFGGDRISGDRIQYNGSGRIHFHMDYLWHKFDAIPSAARLPLYAGVGGRINTGAGYGSSTAVRGVMGIAWLPERMPIDIFCELVPSIQLTPSNGFGIDADIGTRYFF